MKVSDLKIIFNDLKMRKKHHSAKRDISLHPIQINGEQPFLVVGSPNDSWILPTCNICVLPMIIGKPSDKGTDIQRHIRNHAASHQIQTAFIDEPCGMCCKSNCDINVDISTSNKKSILEKNAKVSPSAVVYPKCETFPDIDLFPFKFCKAVAGFPSSNMPVLCRDCPTQNFIWSYNIERHYEQNHSGLNDDDRSKYEGHFLQEKEKDLVRKSYKINVADQSAFDETNNSP